MTLKGHGVRRGLRGRDDDGKERAEARQARDLNTREIEGSNGTLFARSRALFGPFYPHSTVLIQEPHTLMIMYQMFWKHRLAAINYKLLLIEVQLLCRKNSCSPCARALQSAVPKRFDTLKGRLPTSLGLSWIILVGEVSCESMVILYQIRLTRCAAFGTRQLVTFSGLRQTASCTSS
jgi:hypothetical protein